MQGLSVKTEAFMMRLFAKLIWDISEHTGIGLGRFAPIVFGIMIGRKGKRKF
jgi:hypothetical protein